MGTICRRCAAVIPEIEVGRPDCFSCRKSRLRFVRTICLSKYDAELQKAVLKVKHPSAEVLALALADMLVALRGDDLRALAADVIVPVPMHWRRRLLAGTNNPELVAERLGKHLGLPIAQRSLVRCRHTPKQAGSPNERISNVRGAFAVRRPKSIAGRRVLLVDDVLTTGATCNEATRALLDAGADEVTVSTLARA
jgi:ComF family protein